MRRARDGGEGDDLRGEPAALPAASSGVVAAAAAARGALATLLTEPPLLPATRTRFPDPRKAEEPDRTESPGSGAICTDFFGAIEWSPRAGRLYQPPTRAVRVTACEKGPSQGVRLLSCNVGQAAALVQFSSLHLRLYDSLRARVCYIGTRSGDLRTHTILIFSGQRQRRFSDGRCLVQNPAHRSGRQL